MSLSHPEKGKVTVKIINGCPQVEKRVALEMIKEIEAEKKVRRVKLESSYKEKEWLQDLVEAHPVLKGPGCNRSKRKRMQEGFVAHLYAGEKEGYDLEERLRRLEAMAIG